MLYPLLLFLIQSKVVINFEHNNVLKLSGIIIKKITVVYIIGMKKFDNFMTPQRCDISCLCVYGSTIDRYNNTYSNEDQQKLLVENRKS